MSTAGSILVDISIRSERTDTAVEMVDEITDVDGIDVLCNALKRALLEALADEE